MMEMLYWAETGQP